MKRYSSIVDLVLDLTGDAEFAASIQDLIDNDQRESWPCPCGGVRIDVYCPETCGACGRPMWGL